MERVDVPQFQEGLHKAADNIDYLLNLIATRLGLDHNRVLGSRYSLPLLTAYLARRGGHISDHRERDKLLYWYVHTFLWGRYAGSTESYLNVDLAAIEDMDGALDSLIDLLRTHRGDLRLQAVDFAGWSKGTRFYPLLYMMTRVGHAQDFETGIELSGHLLGRSSSLEVHHIFPKSKLYEAGYPKEQVNAIANFTFLTQETNLKVSNRDPAEYLEAYSAANPGAIESHWIPTNRELWKYENYPDFLAARRELLASEANRILESLLQGSIPESGEGMPTDLIPSVQGKGGVDSEEEEELLFEVSNWLTTRGLPPGELLFELADAQTQEPIVVLDLAWPAGLQEGLTPPVALMLDEPFELESLANSNGYITFSDVTAFKEYVEREILEIDPVSVSD